MEDNNPTLVSIVLAGSTGLVRVNNSIAITNKLLFSDIDHLFNKAFCLMNSKDIENCNQNYSSLIETDPINHRLKIKIKTGVKYYY